MLKEFEFNLKDCELTYNENGVAQKSTHLILKAPSNKQAKYADKLGQTVVRALMDLNGRNLSKENDPSKSSGDIDGEAVLFMLKSSSEDFYVVKELFLTFLLEVCFLNGTKLITKHNIDNELSYNESNKIMGEYIANFLLFLPQDGKKK